MRSKTATHVYYASRLFCLGVALTLLFALASCGGSPTGNTGGGSTTTVTSVTPSCTPTTLTAGQSSTCTATVQGQDNPSQAVTWTASPATAGTITSTGVFTASSTLTAITTATITAASTVPGYTNVTGSTTITINPPAVLPPSPTITAAPMVITQGQSTMITWNANAGSTATSATVSGPGLTTSTSLTGNASVTPPATGNETYTITATNAGGSASASVTVTVNAPAPTATLTPSTTTVTQGNSLTLTLVTTNATTCTASSTDGSWSGTVPCNTTATVTPTSTSGSVSYSVTAVGSGGSATASSGTITVTPGQTQLTSITPRVQLVVGEGGYVSITLHGLNIPSSIDVGDVNCTPDSNVQSVQWINSTEVNVILGIDGVHEGSGDRSCQIPSGTGYTAAVPFGFYSSNMCVRDSTSKKTFCLDPQEAIAGQNLSQGVPQNGYVDIFDANGQPDGNFFVGPGRCCIAFDSVTTDVIVDATPYSENGTVVSSPILAGGNQFNAVTANAGGDGMMCVFQPSASLPLSCVSLVGSSTNTFVLANVPNVQSIMIGKASNGDAIVYALTVGSTPAIASADISTGMKTITSRSVAGITAGAPGGSAIIVFDSLGLGVVTSFGDNLAVIFSETTLMETSSVTLPGIPVNTVADTADGLALVGNANATSPGGTFTTINPSNGTAATIPSEGTAILPTALSVNPTGGEFYACPFWLNGSSTPCTSLSIP